MAYSINKYYRNILGLDLRVSDLTRNPNAATEAKNIIYRQTGALGKRTGSKITAATGEGGAGLVKFNSVDVTTGIATEEMLAIDDGLSRYTQETFTITYSGPDIAYYDLYLDPDTSTFQFDMYDNDVAVLEQDLGDGLGASDTTIAQLKVLVDAVSDFSMTISDAGATLAALAPIGRSINISSTGTSTTYNDYTAIPTPGTYTTPFSTHWAAKADDDFETASYTQMLDILYITNGYDVLHKYDGNRVYKAGLPTMDTPVPAVITGGSLDASSYYKWLLSYEYTDAKQNILTSPVAITDAALTTGADKAVTINPRNINESVNNNVGYNNAQAIADGSQQSTEIDVDAGHGILAGDFIYWKWTYGGSPDDSVSSVEVLSVDATTLYLASAIGVTNNDIISTVKISVFRTHGQATEAAAETALFYLEEEFTNDADSSTIGWYSGDIADTALVQEYVPPVKVAAAPPVCKYIDTWRGQLVLTGDRTSVNTVYYSDFDGESFPVDQSFVTESRLGGGNSGIKALDNTLFVFKPRAIVTCTGDLGVDNFQVDALSDDGVGCVAQATLQEIDHRIWFLGNRGIYSVDRTGYKKESEVIEPKFDLGYTAKRAISHYWIEKNLYLVSFPFIDADSGSDSYMNVASSFIMVHDLYRNAWYEWTNINMIGGIAELNGEVHMVARELNPVDSLAKSYTYKFLELDTDDDYADHVTAISFSYKTHWESMGDPSVFKKFLRLKVHSLDGTTNAGETEVFILNVVTEHDYIIADESILTLDFSGGSVGWGEAGWGTAPWGDVKVNHQKSKLKSKRARALRTTFTNAEVHQNVLISGYEYEISASYDMQIKE